MVRVVFSTGTATAFALLTALLLPQSASAQQGWRLYDSQRGMGDSSGSSYRGSYPSSPNYSAAPTYTYPTAPATNVQSAAPGSGGNSDRAFYSPAESFPEERAVSLNIAVPAGASIWFDGVATTQQGALRRFISPRIDSDQDYVYNITAKWTSNGKEIAQSRRLVVRAGDVVNVTFGSATQR
jgi:uncharacterized protein (TIGR03000 family)